MHHFVFVVIFQVNYGMQTIPTTRMTQWLERRYVEQRCFFCFAWILNYIDDESALWSTENDVCSLLLNFLKAGFHADLQNYFVVHFCKDGFEDSMFVSSRPFFMVHIEFLSSVNFHPSHEKSQFSIIIFDKFYGWQSWTQVTSVCSLMVGCKILTLCRDVCWANVHNLAL